jgi:hypothetical protein
MTTAKKTTQQTAERRIVAPRENQEYFIVSFDFDDSKEKIERAIFKTLESLIKTVTDEWGWDDDDITNTWIIHVKDGVPTVRKIVRIGYTLE